MGRWSEKYLNFSQSPYFPYLPVYHFSDSTMYLGHRLKALDMRWMEMV
jgi:hypothetical protein